MSHTGQDIAHKGRDRKKQANRDMFSITQENGLTLSEMWPYARALVMWRPVFTHRDRPLAGPVQVQAAALGPARLSLGLSIELIRGHRSLDPQPSF